jgi:hypothetical protein
MKKARTSGLVLSAVFLLSSLLCCNSQDANKPLDRICVGNECLVISRFSQNVQDSLNGNAVGYALVISANGLLHHQAAYGKGRTSADPPEKEFSVEDRMNIASVSKTITAVAVLQLLDKNKLTTGAKIAPYLPSDWTLGTGADQLTFKQLLTHTTGLKDGDVGYEDLKTVIANGVTESQSQLYRNRDFGLFRVIIPYLDGFSEAGVSDKPSALAARYLKYVNEHVLPDKKILCKPDKNNPTLFYPFPPGKVQGTAYRDDTLFCGSEGLHMSAMDLMSFLVQRRYGTALLSASQRAEMDDTASATGKDSLGWQGRFDVKNGTSFFHGGYFFFPTESSGNGELNSLIMDFSSGIQLSLLVNSRCNCSGGLPGVVISAYNKSWEPK